MKKVDIEYVKSVVESEGLEYAVCNYLSADHIEDTTLSALWKRASNAMRDVEKYLKEHGGWPED